MLAHAADSLVIDHLVPQDHPVDDFRMPSRQVEALFRVVLGERLLAREHGFCGGRSEHAHVVGVLGDEALEVARVVGFELSLDRKLGVHGVSFDRICEMRCLASATVPCSAGLAAAQMASRQRTEAGTAPDQRRKPWTIPGQWLAEVATPAAFSLPAWASPSSRSTSASINVMIAGARSA